MKNIKIVIFIITGLIFCNCNIHSQETDTLVQQKIIYINRNDLTFLYAACDVKYIGAVAGRHYEKVSYNTDRRLGEQANVSQKNFLLSILTSNVMLSKYVFNRPNVLITEQRWVNWGYVDIYYGGVRKPKLERHFEDDYFGINRNDKNVVYVDTIIARPYRGIGLPIPEELEYRTDGVKNLKISANRQIFGQKAGENLNEFFRIKYFYPLCIVDAQTDSLLYGRSNQRRGEPAPQTITEWLKLNPLAQPAMILQFNRKIPEKLPVKVQFFVEMETDKGVVLRDTTSTVIITR